MALSYIFGLCLPGFAGVTEVKCRRDFICSFNSVDSVSVLFEAAAATVVAAAF